MSTNSKQVSVKFSKKRTLEKAQLTEASSKRFKSTKENMNVPQPAKGWLIETVDSKTGKHLGPDSQDLMSFITWELWKDDRGSGYANLRREIGKSVIFENVAKDASHLAGVMDRRLSLLFLSGWDFSLGTEYTVAYNTAPESNASPNHIGYLLLNKMIYGRILLFPSCWLRGESIVSEPRLLDCEHVLANDLVPEPVQRFLDVLYDQMISRLGSDYKSLSTKANVDRNRLTPTILSQKRPKASALANATTPTPLLATTLTRLLATANRVTRATDSDTKEQTLLSERDFSVGLRVDYKGTIARVEEKDVSSRPADAIGYPYFELVSGHRDEVCLLLESARKQSIWVPEVPILSCSNQMPTDMQWSVVCSEEVGPDEKYNKTASDVGRVFLRGTVIICPSSWVL